MRTVEAYQRNNQKQYMVMQFGDPMELFQCFIYEHNEITHCYLHLFLKCIFGALTHFHCHECKVAAAKESHFLPFVTMVSSVENRLSINVLVHNALLNSDMSICVGVVTSSSCCSDLLFML